MVAPPPGPTDPPEVIWAEAQVARLVELGTGHGRARRSSESVLAYTRALADGPVPDERLAEVGQVLSTALFGQTAPSPATRADVKATVTAIIDAHPPPSRAERKRAAEGIEGSGDRRSVRTS